MVKRLVPKLLELNLTASYSQHGDENHFIHVQRGLAKIRFIQSKTEG